ncbi:MULTISPECIES: HNH endonuclease signature motif containing protein [unclassified Ensifer]|uniref:HNH endonuclease signature motif containing protein n=1 Tax=unclassified Ensifer TaxID=2633371 RepID=UPI003010403B
MQPQRKIPAAIKKLLIDKAGSKCANPGCPNRRLEIHHIRAWAVYKAHDAEHMIAVCPACHDDIHHGRLKASDQTLYTWKGIQRPKNSDDAFLYVEPSSVLRLLTGSFHVASERDNVSVFNLSKFSKLSIRVLDGDILQVSARHQDAAGNQILRIVENNVRREIHDNEIRLDFRPGRIAASAPKRQPYLPGWLLSQWSEIGRKDSTFSQTDDRAHILDIEVVKPGTVRVKGIWANNDEAMVLTQESFFMCARGRKPMRLSGPGPDKSGITWCGPEGGTLFGFR